MYVCMYVFYVCSHRWNVSETVGHPHGVQVGTPESNRADVNFRPVLQLQQRRVLYPNLRDAEVTWLRADAGITVERRLVQTTEF